MKRFLTLLLIPIAAWAVIGPFPGQNSTPTSSGGGGGGITSINGDTTAAQLITSATTGNDFNINTSGGNTVVSLPDASATARGAVTTGTQSFAGLKTFSDILTAGSSLVVAGNISSVRGISYDFPYAQGATGTFLKNNGTGGLSWAAASGGGSGITSINGDTTAAQVIVAGTAGTDFAVNSSGGTSTLNLPDAGAAARGVVTTGSQTLAGTKTLSSAPILSSLTAQAIPYLNASKTLADGAWRQADSTFATTFTPSGSPTSLLSIDYSGLTTATRGVYLSGTVPNATHSGYDIDWTGNTSSSKFIRGYRFSIDGGAYSSGGVIGAYYNVAAVNTSNNLGTVANQFQGNTGVWSQVSTQNTTGLAVGVTSGAFSSRYQMGGHFTAGGNAGGTSPKALGVKGAASPDGTGVASTIGVYGVLASTQSAAESSWPTYNAASAFDSGDVVAPAFVALNNGSSVFQIQNNGVTIIGANNGGSTHLVNGNFTIGSSLLFKDKGATPGFITVGAPTTVSPYKLALPGSQGAANTMLFNDGNGNLTWASTARSVGVTFDGGGSAITVGTKRYIEVPYNGRIIGWTALGDQSGSIVVDVWKDTYANYPPTVADTITDGDKPTISTATKGQNLNVTVWNNSITAGDIIAFNVDSVTTLTNVTVTLKVVPR